VSTDNWKSEASQLYIYVALIAGRIVWLQRGIDNHYGFGGGRRSNFGPTLTVIVESGAIYSICLTVVIALYYLYGLTEQNVAVRAMPQVMVSIFLKSGGTVLAYSFGQGIIFSFIIVRVASRVSSESIESHSDSRAQRTAITEMFHSSQTDGSYTSGAIISTLGRVD
jgi:hypothetical protein